LNDDAVDAHGLVELVRDAKAVRSGRELEPITSFKIRHRLELLVSDDLNGRFDERSLYVRNDAPQGAFPFWRRAAGVLLTRDELFVADLAFVSRRCGFSGWWCGLGLVRDLLIATFALGRRGWRRARGGLRVCGGVVTSEREGEGNEPRRASLS
jgi:hypothetical protein